MFETFIEKPVFNLLELIYAVIPGHDLGISIIVFTIVIRLLMWPLVKRQLHQSRLMRRLQPELKKVKKAAAGDRQKLARLQMELYKEHGVKPMATIGTLIIQVPIFIGLFFTIRKLINDPGSLQNFAYEPVRNLPFIKDLASGSASFDPSLLGIIDLHKAGISSEGLYIGAVIVVVLSAIVQYYQGKLLLPNNKDSKKLSQILREASEGKEADQADVSEAVSRLMTKFLPFMIFAFTLPLPSALALYFLVSAAVGYAQQAYVLNQDQEEMTQIANEPIKEEKPTSAVLRTKKKKTSKKSKKRRK
jgi:YidC/Oxa1 family membrane protein insertase